MELCTAIQTMTRRIVRILEDCSATVYLYGSYVLNDFRLGWSDIDILVLTQKGISQEQAEQLVYLRQTMLTSEPDNPYYRCFEGGMLTLHAFVRRIADRVVYWGTSGQRITHQYDFDACCMRQLHDYGILLYGKEVRDQLPKPSYDALKATIQSHYETIRTYAGKTGRSLYSYGWLLDISRCIYTLRTGRIASKTEAAEWALQEKIFPSPHVLEKTLIIRKDPLKYKDDNDILDYAEALADIVQQYADVLEMELKNAAAATSDSCV